MMIYLISRMALAAAADPMIPGSWLIEVIKVGVPALGTAAAAWAIAMKRAGREKAPAVKIEEPVPEVPVKRVYSPPTFFQHRALEERVSRVEADQREMRRENAENFMKLMEAGETRQNRLLDKMDEMARGIHARIDKIKDKNPGKEDGRDG